MNTPRFYLFAAAASFLFALPVLAGAQAAAAVLIDELTTAPPLAVVATMPTVIEPTPAIPASESVFNSGPKVEAVESDEFQEAIDPEPVPEPDIDEPDSGSGGSDRCQFKPDEIFILDPACFPLKAAFLTVVKQVSGGAKSASDFTLFVENGAVWRRQVLSGTPVLLAPGSYSVSEIADPAYTAGFSGDCDAEGKITLLIGERKKCVITNTFQDNDNNGGNDDNGGDTGGGGGSGGYIFGASDQGPGEGEVLGVKIAQADQNGLPGMPHSGLGGGSWLKPFVSWLIGLFE